MIIFSQLDIIKHTSSITTNLSLITRNFFIKTGVTISIVRYDTETIYISRTLALKINIGA